MEVFKKQDDENDVRKMVNCIRLTNFWENTYQIKVKFSEFCVYFLWGAGNYATGASFLL